MSTPSFSLPVYKTENTSIFKKLDGNRELYPEHVIKLVKLFASDENFTKLNPIRVNEHMQIIDGQHRVAAYERYQKLGEGDASLYYVIIDGLKLSNARIFNAGSKPWIPRDYAQAFAAEGNENYKTYLTFMKKYNMNHYVLVYSLTGQIKSSMFRDGTFKVVDAKRAHEMLTALAEVGEYHLRWKMVHFSQAFLRIWNHPDYDHQRMIEQIKLYGEGLETVPNRSKEMIPALNMVYNWKRKEKINLIK